MENAQWALGIGHWALHSAAQYRAQNQPLTGLTERRGPLECTALRTDAQTRAQNAEVQTRPPLETECLRTSRREGLAAGARVWVWVCTPTPHAL